jgi:hypothetical protein
MPPLSVGSAADPNIALANAGGDGVQEAQQQKPLPQNQQTPQKKPPMPLGTGQGRTPPAPRNPEKPGMEMTELERSHEQEFARFNEKYRQLKEAERRQPLWDKIIRSPAPVITPENKLQDLLPDDWQEKFDPRYVAWTRAAAERNNIPLEPERRTRYRSTDAGRHQRGLDPKPTTSTRKPRSTPAPRTLQHYRRFGNWPKAAAAYNAGPNYVRDG